MIFCYGNLCEIVISIWIVMEFAMALFEQSDRGMFAVNEMSLKIAEDYLAPFFQIFNFFALPAYCNFCSWPLCQCLLNILRTIIHKSQPDSLVTWTFRSHHETFIRRSWYSVLPDLGVTIECHIKKTVVGMTQLIAALLLNIVYRLWVLQSMCDVCVQLV